MVDTIPDDLEEGPAPLRLPLGQGTDGGQREGREGTDSVSLGEGTERGQTLSLSERGQRCYKVPKKKVTRL